jgi:hypothetical protein
MSGSTFDPNAAGGNPIVESSSTTAIWDDAEEGSVLVSKDSGKPVLDDPVITGSYEVDHLDDATLDGLPTPVGHVPAKKLHSILNGTTSEVPGVIALGACSRECCSTFWGESSKSAPPSAPMAAPVVSEEAVALASDPKQRSLFDRYVANANVGGVAELVARWESASKRLMELVERAKSAQAKIAAPATLSLPGPSWEMRGATGVTGAAGGEDQGRPPVGMVGPREVLVDDGQDVSLLPPPGTPPSAATGGATMAAAEVAEAEPIAGPVMLVETTESPMVHGVTAASEAVEETEVDKQIADIARTTRERVKIIQKEGQDEISAVKRGA